MTETLHSERGPVLHHTVWQYCQEASSTAGVEANSSTGGTEDGWKCFGESPHIGGKILQENMLLVSNVTKAPLSLAHVKIQQ